MSDRRDEFITEIYKQMFNDINRHIMVVWQSVGVLVGAFAIFALVEKKVLSLDIASTIIILLCAWLYAHLLDASYWYNRNLVIIANIERQFLGQDDLKHIHYYFGKHRPDNKMITHLKIQLALGIGLSGLVLLFHFFDRVLPGLSLNLSHLESWRALPYIFTIASLFYCRSIQKDRNMSYKEFIKNSPGIEVTITDIEYGPGHGFGKGTGG
jgi:hypothetical protein